MDKEFCIEQVFTIKKVYGRPQKTYELGNIPYVTGTKDNNGVVGFVSADEKSISKGNCISVDPITGLSCYQPADFVGRGFSGASINLLYNDNLDEKTALFMCSTIEKVASSVAAYTNLFNSTRLATANIKVPVIENPNSDHEYTVDDIDWQYMRDYITELEHDYITELDAYLQATGLNDYELTEDDKKILSLSAKRASDEDGILEDNSEDEVRFGEFDITKIFTVKNTKCIMQKQIVPNSGDIPYVTAGDSNNAVSTYIDCPIEWTDVGNCVFIGGKTLVITYQEKDFCSNDSHNLALYLNNEEYRNGYVYRYMVGALKSALSHKYYWGDSISRKKIQNDKMLLPIKSDGTPDFDYMERYIRAIEKVVIADVVKYKDKVIEETRKVVGA